MNWKWIVIVSILLLLIVFTAQNYETVRIKFLAWSFQSSSAISIFISLMIGFLVGVLMCIRKDQ
ncbi:MAG: lipopolysaccharide assembly protein LapA domain-containing protein [Candidatus Omnitrophota bacterium]